MLKVKMQDKYQELTDGLPISGYGYEEIGLVTPVKSLEEYLVTKDPYYSEFVLLPDGRIIEASPSHAIVMDSLLDFLYKGKFPLSHTWFVEERLYYTRAIMCWEESQFGFGELTREQKDMLSALVKSETIQFNYSCFPMEKQEYFLVNRKKIHREANQQ